ncbi:transcriptional repressor [Nonomuraea angiospora]|uniref:Fur family transcriptional regulator n=1 Tax=Nonomuraea angiospora TaxID=46172 RepID=UPI0033F37125
MSEEADLGEALTRLGLRRTVPRLTILTALRDAATHLSVPRLHRLVTSAYEMISVSTVYRNVTVMTAHGVLHSVDHAGETLFGLSTTPHHHLICRRCDVLVELPADHLAAAGATVMERTGFAMDPVGQVLRGLCRRCRRVLLA